MGQDDSFLSSSGNPARLSSLPLSGAGGGHSGRQSNEAVTVEKIAAEAEVGAASIFRYFGTKNRIVIWDESCNSFNIVLHEGPKAL
jgi:Bacterial regulatory proteins, tetR family